LSKASPPHPHDPPIYEVKGNRPYDARIDLQGLADFFISKGPPHFKNINLNLERSELELIYEMGRSRSYYTFREHGFQFCMTDIKGRPLDDPAKAIEWAINSALGWIRQTRLAAEQAAEETQAYAPMPVDTSTPSRPGSERTPWKSGRGVSIGRNFETRVVNVLRETGYPARRTGISQQSQAKGTPDILMSPLVLRVERLCCRHSASRKNARSIRVSLTDLEDVLAYTRQRRADGVSR